MFVKKIIKTSINFVILLRLVIFAQNNNMKKFKYQSEIDALINKGKKMPDIFLPENKEAYRFVFCRSIINHLPVYIQKPQRALKDNAVVEGYALSCFETRDAADKMQQRLVAKFNAIGDSLCCGIIENPDGMITAPSPASRHFELFEFENCDLSTKFKVIKTYGNF